MSAQFMGDLVTPQTLRQLRAMDVEEGSARCRVCGCTDNYGCAGGCWWAERDLCSSCASRTTSTREGSPSTI